MLLKNLKLQMHFFSTHELSHMCIEEHFESSRQISYTLLCHIYEPIASLTVNSCPSTKHSRYDHLNTVKKRHNETFDDASVAGKLRRVFLAIVARQSSQK